MVLFNSDYTEGAHPKIMELMMSSNMEQTGGYGMDAYCDKARALIRQQCGREDIDVQFLVGGTQTNLTVIAATLRPHQGVISADTGHINVHETGAVEATGHKVIALPSADGKLTAQQVLDCYHEHWNDATHEHIVQPGMVYISNPTETGSIYHRSELQALAAACRECGLPLFMDGARLGYGLAAEDNDLDLPTITDFVKLASLFLGLAGALRAFFSKKLVWAAIPFFLYFLAIFAFVPTARFALQYWPLLACFAGFAVGGLFTGLEPACWPFGRGKGSSKQE